jgi:adenylate cyclase
MRVGYMACCGCPDAYDDHAPRAADFAIGLGDAFARAGAATGVTHLCCRVGLHSGPVVAGVLRAEKHRFQLFGDTVWDGMRDVLWAFGSAAS